MNAYVARDTASLKYLVILDLVNVQALIKPRAYPESYATIDGGRRTNERLKRRRVPEKREGRKM